MRHVPHRLVAWVLVMLAASPFTPPFSTCTMAMLVATAGSAPILDHQAHAAAAVHAIADAAPAPLLDEEQFNEATIAVTAIGAPHAHAQRLSTPAPTPTPAAVRQPLVSLRL